MLNNARETRNRSRQKFNNGGTNLLSRNHSGKQSLRIIKRHQRSHLLVVVAEVEIAVHHVLMIVEIILAELRGGVTDLMAVEEEMGRVGKAEEAAELGGPEAASPP